MRRVIAILMIVVASATALTGCHRLGLVSTPKTPAKAVAKAPAQPFSLSVQNGGGVKGKGAEMVKRLQALGFKVSAIATNAKKSNHPTTLIVFKPGLEADAAAIQKKLGIGAPQPASASFEATTDILVVVGRDF